MVVWKGESGRRGRTTWFSTPSPDISHMVGGRAELQTMVKEDEEKKNQNSFTLLRLLKQHTLPFEAKSVCLVYCNKYVELRYMYVAHVLCCITVAS